jgi:D-lactate dehydrogenase
MKIIVYEVEDWERDAFAPLEEDHEVVYHAAPLDEDTDIGEDADADILSAFIYSELTATTLSRFENLQMIATRSTGYDHVDAQYCRDHDIAVCNVPTYGANTVAEHAFGLLLTISHNLVEAINRTRRGDFDLKGLRGFDLRGKTFGVLGTGDIGLHTLRIAAGFEMECIAYDVAPDKDAASRLGFTYVDFEELLERSDIISLHVPLNDRTRHMISEDEFDAMRDGVVIINTARGAVIDTRALCRALADGKVAAAGLDVLSEEPAIREEAELLRPEFREKFDIDALLSDHVLLRQRNVYITPHSGFDTREAIERILETTVDNIEAFADGEPTNVVDLS